MRNGKRRLGSPKVTGSVSSTYPGSLKVTRIRQFVKISYVASCNQSWRAATPP